jgi:hypothetical protein
MRQIWTIGLVRNAVKGNPQHKGTDVGSLTEGHEGHKDFGGSSNTRLFVLVTFVIFCKESFRRSPRADLSSAFFPLPQRPRSKPLNLCGFAALREIFFGGPRVLGWR